MVALHHSRAGLHSTRIWLGGLRCIIHHCCWPLATHLTRTGAAAICEHLRHWTSCASTDPAHTSYKCGKYLAYDFSARPKSLLAQRPSGLVMTISSQTFSAKNVVWIPDILERFSGHLAAIGVKRSDVDFFFVALRARVEPYRNLHRDQIRKLWTFVGKLLDGMPSRCMPVICMDANGRVGVSCHLLWVYMVFSERTLMGARLRDM